MTPLPIITDRLIDAVYDNPPCAPQRLAVETILAEAIHEQLEAAMGVIHALLRLVYDCLLLACISFGIAVGTSAILSLATILLLA